jgi:hypothetical protein
MTEKYRKVQTSEERDLAALQRRHSAADTSDTIPNFVGEEDTKPTELVQQRLERDPVLKMMWERMTRMKRESSGALRRTADVALEAHQASNPEILSRLNEVESQLDKINTAMGIMKWVAGFLIAATLGSVVVIATKIYSWGASSGSVEIRLDYIERDLESVKRESSNRYDRGGGYGRRDNSNPPDVKVTP